MFVLFDDSKRIEKNESEDVAYLALVEDAASDSLLCGILEDNGIEYMRKERSRGVTTGVVVGYNIFGTDFYVRREKLEEAKQLYQAFICGSAEVKDQSPTSDEAPDDK